MTDPDPMKPTFPGDELDPYRSPKTPGEKKPRGCFFYGCIISLFAFVVLAIGIGLLAWYLVSKGNEYITKYTDTAPLPIPAVEMPAEEREALNKKVEEFKTEIDEKTAVEPLVLTSDQINALIDEQPDLKGRMHVDLEGDTIKGTISMPLTENVGPFKLKGRYLNAKGTFTASLVEGAIDVRVKDAEVRGMPIPPQFMSELSKQNLAKDVKLDEEARRTIARFERIEVKDGKLYIIPAKPSAEPAEDDAAKAEDDQPAAPSEDMPKEEGETKPDTPPAAEEPATEPKAEDSAPQEPEPTTEPKAEDSAPQEPETANLLPGRACFLLSFATEGFTMPTFPG